MSNLETAPAELACTGAEAELERGRVLDAREVPLGGPRAMTVRRTLPLGDPRAMTVRRTLPQRAQSLIGAWCFVDHYGPDDVAATGGMRVAGHPHTGLQTVSWLFSGEVEHSDTTGAHAYVRPGELNLMTAGSGIAHSEYSTPDTSVLHGAQLWVALPERDRFVDAGFESYLPPVLEPEGARVLVFLGSLLGHTSPVRTYSPLLGADVTVAAGRTLRLDVDPAFEHGVLVDSGVVTTAGVSASQGQLVYAGARQLTIEASAGAAARVLLLGGEPLGEQLVMWWNFIGRSHEEIVTFREEWEQERTHSARSAPGRYGRFPKAWQETLPAPDLPNTRLRLRG
ncbi:MAG: pirin family protein [Streptosporangiales bacterium]|nr:pirin family protein [Streptosporangiales bacterium]